jgi:hypothetical protein
MEEKKINIIMLDNHVITIQLIVVKTLIYMQKFEYEFEIVHFFMFKVCEQ